MRRNRQGQLDLASLSHEELAFHLEVSTRLCAFAGLSRRQNPSASILQDNIKALSAESWESAGISLCCPKSEGRSRD
jgi:hypothetical protein